MRIILLLAAFLAVSNALPTQRKLRYDNYKVFRIVPKTEKELTFIRNVASEWEQLDFWKEPSHVGNPVDVMVSPVAQASFLDSLARPGLVIETMIADVQQMIDEEAAKMAKVNPDVAGFDYFTYHTMDEINAWMDAFVAENAGVTKVSVSTSYLGETVYGLRFEMQPGTSNVAYIQGGIHAKEWISPATVINFARQFVEGYGKDTTITDMLDNFIWIIVPVYNPDGFRYSHTDDRFWRKNRNDNGGNSCKGVDLNRNFDWEWGGGSSSICADGYQGPSALSEPENSGAKTFLSGFGADLKLYIDFHSYGQYWLYPWSYSSTPTHPHPHRDALNLLAVNAEAAIRSVHGTAFFVGESGPDASPVTGASEDFAYGSLGVKYSYVVGLRDDGQYGVLLPEDQIQPVAEEMIEGLKVVGAQLVKENGS